jgi:hypothetical protein
MRITSTLAAGAALALLAASPASAAPGVSFADAVTYGVGTFGGPGPMETSAAAIHANGDDAPDVLVTNYFGGIGPTLLLNNGDGTFESPGTTIPVGLAVGTLAVGDFNGDGVDDFAATNFVQVVTFTGNGDGTFTQRQSQVLPQGGQEDARVHDVNGDGKDDLVVLTRFGFAVLPGQGDGTFGVPKITLIPSFTLSSVAPANLDGDSVPDLIVTDAGVQRVYAYRGNKGADGKGNFTFTQTGSGFTSFVPGGSAPGDFNEDGLDDAVAFNEFNIPGTSLKVLLNDGAGGFTDGGSFDGGFTPISGAVEDFDDDGHLDVVSSDTVASQVVVLAGDGAGGFTVAARKTVSLFGQTPAVADFNDDNRPDIAVGGSSAGIPFASGLSILLNTSEG